MNNEKEYYKKYSNTPLIDRFIHASRGIRNAWRKEANFRIEALIALLILGAMFVLPLTNTERSVLVLVIALVLALEIINSIFERVLDIIHPQFSDEVKKIKDTMAGVVFLASIASIIVGLFVLVRPLMDFDLFVHANLEIFRTGWWLVIAESATLLGGWQVIVLGTVLLAVWLMNKKKYELLSFLLGLVVLGEGFLLFLKWILGRERPIDVNFLWANGYSFPSGHVFFATIFYISLALIINSISKNKNYVWVLAVIFILLVALTRIILSVHWFSDVLGGLIFGIFWLLLWYGINERFWQLKIKIRRE